MHRLLEWYFGLASHGTTVRRELLGGATTFAAMAYIIVVNPAILAHAGIDARASTVATILTACFGSVLMGLYANRPIAVAPYMGENAFIAFSMAFAWQLRLGTVFVAGALFLILTLIGARGWLARAISPSMKHSFAAGIGMFLMLVGLVYSGVVVGNPVPMAPLKIGNLHEAKVLLAIAGFLIMAVLLLWNVRGAILIGIVAIASIGYCLGLGNAPAGVLAWPWEYGLAKIAFQLNIRGVFEWTFLPFLLTLCLVSFLDTLGTLVGVGAAGEMLDDKGRGKGNFADMNRPMLVDSLACMFGALVGTSTSGAFIESAAGIRAGARTGLAALATGLLFALALFFIPLFEVLQDNQMSYAYGPALVIVGMLMAGAFRKIDSEDWTEQLPAFTTIAIMVFTYNIANGLTAGLVIYPIVKLAVGRWSDVHPAMAVLGIMSAAYLALGNVH